jgi:hypothetical protein
VQVAGSRYYNPGLGRWASRDPIGERGGGNLFACLRNQLPSGVDVLGLSGVTSDWALSRCVAFSPTAKLAVYDWIGFTAAMGVSGRRCDCCNRRTGEFRALDYVEYRVNAELSFGVGWGVTLQLPVLGKFALSIIGPQVTVRPDLIGFRKDCGQSDYALRSGAWFGSRWGGSFGISDAWGISGSYWADVGVGVYAVQTASSVTIDISTRLEGALTVTGSIMGVDVSGEFFRWDRSRTASIGVGF